MSDPTPIGVQLGLKTGREYGEMIVKLRDVIEKAACWFDEYTDLHAAKRTQEGFDKAAVNANRASELRAALGDEPMPKPADWLDPRRPEEWEPATMPTDPQAIAREMERLLDDYQRARSDKRIFDAVGIRSSVFELVAKNRACIIAGLDLLATQENEVFGLEGDE